MLISILTAKTALVALLSQSSSSPVIHLADAVSSGRVTYTATGNKNSTHYHSPLIVIIKNNSSTNLDIRLDPGDGFTPEDIAYQKLIVTSPMVASLKPGEQKEVLIAGMCTQPENKGQSPDVKYALVRDFSSEAVRLAKFISEYKLQTIQSQRAMWSVTAGEDISEIGSDNTELNNKLLALVSELTGKPIPKFEGSNEPVRRFRYEVSGEFAFDYKTPKDVIIGLFNTNNTIETEMYYQKAVSPGYHKVEYAFDAAVYPDDLYYIRFVVDGVIKAEWEVKPRG